MTRRMFLIIKLKAEIRARQIIEAWRSKNASIQNSG